ncbi:hypothetical protein ACFY5D_00045 [Paeniglutamicibacter sp. NPDC012692]|uniref:hypothetical protein n=1 Tax=Paeniglutamicibacter sp. NPDC012692 TaxID=3364388 RepID=UPI0036A786FE
MTDYDESTTPKHSRVQEVTLLHQLNAQTEDLQRIQLRNAELESQVDRLLSQINSLQGTQEGTLRAQRDALELSQRLSDASENRTTQILRQELDLTVEEVIDEWRSMMIRNQNLTAELAASNLKNDKFIENVKELTISRGLYARKLNKAEKDISAASKRIASCISEVDNYERNFTSMSNSVSFQIGTLITKESKSLMGFISLLWKLPMLAIEVKKSREVHDE